MGTRSQFCAGNYSNEEKRINDLWPGDCSDEEISLLQNRYLECLQEEFGELKQTKSHAFVDLCDAFKEKLQGEEINAEERPLAEIFSSENNSFHKCADILSGYYAVDVNNAIMKEIVTDCFGEVMSPSQIDQLLTDGEL